MSTKLRGRGFKDEYAAILPLKRQTEGIANQGDPRSAEGMSLECGNSNEI